MSKKTSSLPLFDAGLVRGALIDSVRKLTPRAQWRNPVMLVVYLGAILTTLLWAQALGGDGEAPAGFILAIALWLWFTVLFANFAEALAEGRSRAQAASLRGMKRNTVAKVLTEPRFGAQWVPVQANELRAGVVMPRRAGSCSRAHGTRPPRSAPESPPIPARRRACARRAQGWRQDPRR